MAEQIIKTENELKEAIKGGEDSIIVEGDLAQKVIKIKATGKVAWIVALGAMIVAIIVSLKVSFVSTPAEPATKMPLLGATPPSGSDLDIGMIVMIGCIVLAVVAIGIALLNQLKSYKVEKLSNQKVKLTK